jgi:hypothetical protein
VNCLAEAYLAVAVILAVCLSSNASRPARSIGTRGWCSREEVERLIRSGAIADAQSIAAHGLFLLHRR